VKKGPRGGGEQLREYQVSPLWVPQKKRKKKDGRKKKKSRFGRGKKKASHRWKKRGHEDKKEKKKKKKTPRGKRGQGPGSFKKGARNGASFARGSPHNGGKIKKKGKVSQGKSESKGRGKGKGDRGRDPLCPSPKKTDGNKKKKGGDGP